MKPKTSAHCLGTYPKWFARVVRWAINRNGSSTVEVVFKGRGRAKDGGRYPYGVPVHLAGRVAIYVQVKKSRRFPLHTCAPLRALEPAYLARVR